MAKDRDDQLDQEEFSLDAILAEFGSGSGEARQGEPPAVPSDAPAEAPTPPRDELGEEDWFPESPYARQRKEGRESAPEGPRGVVTPFPGRGLPEEEEEEEADPEPEEEEDLPPDTEPEEVPEKNKVLEFPEPEPENPVAAGIDQLRRRADQFAEHMFEEEGAEDAQEVRRAEKLIPGVDREEELLPVRERKPRKVLPPAPDLPPAELAKRYSRGLKGLRLRLVLAFFPLAALLYLTLALSGALPLPGELAGQGALCCYLSAGLQGAVLLLCVDALLKGLARPFYRRPGMDTMTALANLAALTDALTLPTLYGGTLPRQPFCAAAALSLWFVLWGELQERRGQRLACRTAASASEPYLVTRDEGKWNGRDTYTKWSGPLSGFGSQVQGENGAESIYRRVVPVLFLACVLFSLLSSVGRERKEDLLWCLSATLCAAAPLSATLCFGLPWRKLSKRLSKSGAAIAGWQGVTNTTGSSNLLLTDIDLFPVGAVSLNGVKIFGDFPIERVVGFTATVIRDAGSGLDKVFHDLLRSQGAIYRHGEGLTAHEGGGLSETIRGQQVLVGSASFMVLMDVALPPGLKVKNAVFCAIDGDLAGIFALNYHLPGTVAPAIDSLIHNRITPVLATRDFNLIPSMLRQRFKLPAEKMEFPSVDRRRELSEPDQDHSETLTAVLCREGLGPYAEAVVGSRRLRTAVRLSAVLCCLGAAAGALLAFYLTFVAAYDSLTAVNLVVFLLMWLVPTPLIAGWVDRY